MIHPSNWIWVKSRAFIKRPKVYSGKPLTVTVTNHEGDVISRHIMLPAPPYKASDLEFCIFKRLQNVARDITVIACGYKIEAPTE